MNFVKKYQRLAPKRIYLEQFLRAYWFAPQDVLLRSVEANIIHALALKRPILDIGIGDGGISSLLFPLSFSIDVGIDNDKTSIERAAKTRVYKKVIRASAEAMPFPHASFRTVVSNSTFEHIRHDRKAVEEVARVLKKNGYFFITVPSAYLPKTLIALEGGGKRGKEALRRFNQRVEHFHYRSLNEWRILFARFSLELVFYKYYFPQEVTKLWYTFFTLSVKKIRQKELWSYLGHSHFRHLIPKQLVITLLRNRLMSSYKKGFTVSNGEGSMLFMVAKKM